MHTLSNSEDPDEMPQHSAVCCISSASTPFDKTKQSSEKEIQFHLEIITFDPSIYTIEHPKVTLRNQKELSFST